MGLVYRALFRVSVARLTNMFPIPTDCGHPAPYCAEERAYHNARFADAYVWRRWAPPSATRRCAPGQGWVIDRSSC